MKRFALLGAALAVVLCTVVDAQVQLKPWRIGDADYFTQCFPLYSKDDPTVTESGLSGSSTNFQITAQCDNESNANAEVYSGAGEILSITTIGTHEDPGADNIIRMGACSGAGTYQLMTRDAQVAIAGCSVLTFTFAGDDIMTQQAQVDFTQANLNDVKTAVVEANDESAPVLHRGTCDGSSTTTYCNDATLTQADDFWNGYTQIAVDGFPGRCVRDFVADDDRLVWAPVALPGSTAGLEYELLLEPSCRNFP